ncbi:MAG TPA: class I SAM-dependent methyltransferase [Mycobacterium sp.]|nr:class I SAM-dependent methyltransferase [Mycobacterium sp.]
MTALDGDINAPAEDTKRFAQRIAAAIDGASVTMLISVGHRTGLFETMAGLAAATSAEIAAAAGLQERYVREWLGGMAAGEIVDYDPATARYVLPPHRAAVLTRAGGTRNLAPVALSLPALGAIEDQIVECFRHGGGVPYSAYHGFTERQAEQSARLLDALLIDQIVPLVDGLTEQLRTGVDVADFGCGSGHAINLLARAFPASRFTGIDFAADAVAAGAAEAEEFGVTNAVFESGDLAQLDLIEEYDVITAFNTIHDQAQPARVLANIFAALRPGGVLLMADVKASSRVEDNVGVLGRPYTYAMSTMHCMPVSLALDGAGLGTAWGRQLATAMLAEAGFTDVTIEELKADPGKYYYIAQKPAPAADS